MKKDIVILCSAAHQYKESSIMKISAISNVAEAIHQY